MDTLAEILKNLGLILGGISSIWKAYKEVIKPYLNKRKKRKK
jgi:hypothetical protein